MRCLVCGAEMRVTQVVQDNTMMVPGYEHQTLQCVGCDEVERRFVFSRGSEPAEPVPVSTGRSSHPAVPNVWARAVARLRGRQIDSGREAE
jgi:hypothetical protein